jgi:transketolase N-terminal domain/subunit
MNQPARFKAAGWDVHRVDGHDMNSVSTEAIEKARQFPQGRR